MRYGNLLVNRDGIGLPDPKVNGEADRQQLIAARRLALESGAVGRVDGGPGVPQLAE